MAEISYRRHRLPPVNSQKAACAVTVTAEPVALNTAWYVLEPGETGIVLGNGWNDGDYMYG
jgi:hypothetical protein